MALNIRSAFTLSVPLAAAWALLTDIERAAPCFPGATLLGRNEDGSWKANFVVKLGPMSFNFSGRFQITEADESTHKVVVKASGSDTKGRGGATATIDVRLFSEGVSSRVTVDSSVELSGGVAQFGRGAGMIDALSRQMIDQFAINLQRALPAPLDSVNSEGSSDKTDRPVLEAPPNAINAGTLAWRAFCASLSARLRRLWPFSRL